MSGTVIQFPSQKVPSPRRSHRTRGVCVYCFGWRAEVTDFSCYGLGKWCDDCEPVLRGWVESALRESKAAKA
jgi:hypothetical protein